MATTSSSNPVSDLLYDWLTVLQSKAEGLNAYEKYIKDAEAAGSQECAALFRQLHQQDSQLVQQVKQHVFKMVQSGKA